MSTNSIIRSKSVSYSNLLRNCFKLGRIDHAKQLFEEMPGKTVVSWSVMIYGYATNGLHQESMEAFSKMRVSGTSVLDTYAKCRDIASSYKFFEQIENPTVVTYSAMIAGLTHNEQFEEALTFFNQLRRCPGLVLNSVSVLNVFRACNAFESYFYCLSIHGLVIKTGLYLELSVTNAILYMYSNMGDLEAANKIFVNVESKDVISWTTMMGLLVRIKHVSDALNLFYKMRCAGINMDRLVLVHVIMAYGLLGNLKMGRLIHAQAVTCGFMSDVLIANSIVSMYSNCGDLNYCRIVFNQIEHKSLVSWTAIISGYVINGQSKVAFELLGKMRTESNFRLDSIILLGLLTACSELAGLELCQQLHSHAFKAGFLLDEAVQNSLLSAYSKSGDMKLAHRVFEQMANRNLVSWNAIISGYGINGHGIAAVALFREMSNVGQDPDVVTYLSVLNACSHSGLIEDGLLIFKMMVEEKKIIPTCEHYGCVVDMLARSGHLSDARSFMSSIPETVGSDVWKALLSGCHIHGNVELAEFAADRVFHLDPRDSDHIILLSNVYASVGRYKEAEVLRLKMSTKGQIKDPGISLLNEI